MQIRLCSIARMINFFFMLIMIAAVLVLQSILILREKLRSLGQWPAERKNIPFKVAEVKL
jgi:hypothetical protein